MNPENQESDFNPEKIKVKLMPVEELIPGTKPEEAEENVLPASGYTFDDCYIQTFLDDHGKYLLDKRILPDIEARVEVLRNRFKGQIIVDLGADKYGFGYFLSQALGGKGYVGVDKYYSNDIEKRLEGTDMEEIKKRWDHYAHEGSEFRPDAPIPASVVGQDILSFLKRLPDNSASLFGFGIDHHVMPDNKYREEVKKEIQRVLSNEGLYLTYGSSILPENFKPFDKQLKEEGSKITNDFKMLPVFYMKEATEKIS